MSQKEIKLLKPLKRFASHPAFLFRASTRMREHTRTHARRHTNTLSLPSVLITQSPSIPPPPPTTPFSLHLLSPFSLRSICYFTSLPSSLLLSILPRDDTPFSHHTSLFPSSAHPLQPFRSCLALYFISSLFQFLFPSFLASTSLCHL